MQHIYFFFTCLNFELTSSKDLWTKLAQCAGKVLYFPKSLYRGIWEMNWYRHPYSESRFLFSVSYLNAFHRFSRE